MERLKLTGLVAKQHVELIDSKVGSRGRILAQVKGPSLKTLGSIGEGDANQNQFQKFLPLGSASASNSPVRPSELHKVASDSSAKSIATRTTSGQSKSVYLSSTDNDNQGKCVEGGSSSTTNDTCQHEEVPTKVPHEGISSTTGKDTTSKMESAKSSSKRQTGGDGSDDEDFNFDDSDEKNEIVQLTAPEEEEENPSPEIQPMNTDVDFEDLYDCPPDKHTESTHPSDIELFHVVVTEDCDRLEQFLKEISPQEILEIVDTAGRTIYHYAALSRDKLVQDMIFQHVNFYRDAQFENELQALMRKKAEMWMQDSASNGNGWVPPRVKELNQETTQQKCRDWERICSSMDENVQTGNLKQVKWYFQMGVKLSQADVDLLLSFNVSRVMENVILRQLEAIDIQNYYLPKTKHGSDENDDRCDPGVSTFALAKLQRVATNTAGHLQQLPLHRAAMFGNIRAVELLLEDGADPSVRDANGWTPLHYCANAATVNHLAIAQLLVDSPKGVDVNSKSLKGRSPLHIAVRTRNPRIPHNGDDLYATESKNRLAFVTYLHECKADLNLKDKHGSTPLLLTSRRGSVDVARFLLQIGCDSTATGENNWNPLHFAGIISIMMYDIRRPIDVAKNDVVRQMLMNLWTECYKGNVDQAIAARMLKSRYTANCITEGQDSSNREDSTSYHGYMNALQSRESSNIPVASREGRSKHEKVSDLKRTAPSRFLQITVLLLQAGADLLAADKWGITPLLLAATIKDVILMETLLDRISTEDGLLIADTDGNTALHYSYAFCQV
ncbi:LOW QUALITY PROTEIN: Hypothetical protein PHPALM_15110 [Phytophthora palmivora]|uniref:Uncharacterized protein n=1 Tax=Phytophthora palmivora TaxID=4796 RepID=A0A2P4XT81_9STRA|nr:LOW QUALITY PROTEIN: Hypothetical protein PHPALM_15110 [Phytophthora palmivora]